MLLSGIKHILLIPGNIRSNIYTNGEVPQTPNINVKNNQRFTSDSQWEDMTRFSQLLHHWMTHMIFGQLVNSSERLFPEQHFRRVYSKTRALQTHHTRAHLTVWCALWEWGKNTSRGPLRRKISDQNRTWCYSVQIELIKAVLNGSRGGGWGCFSSSRHQPNDAKNFYLTRAFLPQVRVLTASSNTSQTAI